MDSVTGPDHRGWGWANAALTEDVVTPRPEQRFFGHYQPWLQGIVPRVAWMDRLEDQPSQAE